MPDTPSKPNRFWLFAPFVAVIVAFAAWSGWWFYSKNQVLAALDAMAAGGKGYSLSFKSRTIGGFPFRYEIMLEEPHLAEPSGWGLAAPRLDVVAGAFDPTHAVIVAPQGVTVSRPKKGAVAVTGEVLRASVGGLNKRPRFDIEARGFTVTPAAGGQPMPFSAGEAFEAHLRPEGGDTSRLYFGLTNATPTAGTLMARASDGPSSMRLEATISSASALRGRDWPSILRAWSAAGGEMKVVRSEAQVGKAFLSADNSALSVDADGRLRGKLDLRLKEGPSAVLALGGAGVLPEDTAAVGAGLAPQEAHFSLKFKNGETVVGPVPIGRAPQLF